jgi:hypothetical protein
MTKGFKFFILLFFMCMSFTFLSACNQTNSSFIIDYEKNTFQVGEETFVSINSSSTIEVEWSSSDNNIASVDEYGVIKFKAVGFVTITATNLHNPNDFASVDFVVTDAIVTNIIINGEMSGSVGETLSFSYKLEPKKSTAELFWESDNTDLVDVSQNGHIKLLAEGIATIKVTAVDVGMFSTTFKIGIFDYNTIIVDSSLDKEVGEKITYNGKDYYAGFTYVNSLKQAVNSIKENGTIYVTLTNADGSAITEIDNAIALTVVIQDIFKYEPNSMFSNCFDEIKEKLIQLDVNQKYDYTYIPNEDDLIPDPLIPKNFWDKNHVYNSFTIAQLDSDHIEPKFIT